MDERLCTTSEFNNNNTTPKKVCQGKHFFLDAILEDQIFVLV